MQLALDAPGACEKAQKVAYMVILPGHLGLPWLGTVFSGKAEKTPGRLLR